MNMLAKCLEQWNLQLDEKQIGQFHKYRELLIEWNSFMNLTTITEPQEVELKHFVDSLALLSYMDLKDLSLIDLGTGAGFPGVPLKIAIPSLQVTLVDSLQKRIGFLETVVKELNLTGIDAVHARAEDLAHDGNFREQFDVCTSRAVANLATLSEYCLPFVKKGGYFVPYKSDKVEEELQEAAYAIEQTGGSSERIEMFSLPDSDCKRSLIFIRKVNPTPGKYPRKAGTPSKNPLHK